MKRNVLVWCLSVCLLALPLCGQISTASLTGLVMDQSNAVLPQAKVTLKNKATNIESSTQADASGYYVFPTLTPGNYTVTVEMQGFKRATQEVTLETGQRGRLDMSMQVGAVETTVEVQSQISQLSTQDASIGTVVDNNYISKYPLLLRSWDDLLTLVPGVQGLRYTDQGGGTSFGRTGGFNVHGVRSLQNNFILDGIDNNSISENVQELTTQSVRPSVDTIQEFKITTNPYGAEYGRAPGAAISVTTKGGTNHIRGTAYEFLRNKVFDATDFFTNKNKLPKAANVQNQFGANLGGPIKKDKLFFFFDYEGTRIVRGLSRVTTVPLPNERIGDFSDTTKYAKIFDPTTGLQFPNNKIPQASIDPFATKIMNLFPAATNGALTNNFARNAGQVDNSDRYDARIDWQPTSKDSIFGRYSYSNRNRFVPGNFGGIADGTSSSASGRYDLRAHNLVLGWTRPITTRLVNDFHFGFGFNNSQAFQDPFGANKASDFVPGVPDIPSVAGGVSQITFTGLPTFIGSPNFLPKFQKTLQYQFADTISWTKGKHQIKFGADLRAPLRNIFQDIPATRGALNFNRIFTCQRVLSNPASTCAANTGISYGDFLLGDVERAQLTNIFVVDQRLHMYSFFVGDDYKMTPKLTINLGLRYDYATPALEGQNRLANFNPAGAGAMVPATSGSISNRATVNTDNNNFAPRLGIAYQLNQKTVIRTGYGVFYQLFERIGSEDQLALNPPSLIQADFQVSSTAAAPIFLLKNGYPSNFLKLDLQRQKVRGANPNDPNSYVQQWSFSVQRELPANWFFETAYVGTKATHLNTLRNFNQPINGIKPYSGFNQIEYRDPLGNSIYHGLEATIERRFRGGLAYRSAYTWSKSIDNTSEHLSAYGSNSFSQDGNNFKAWRGPSDFDSTHRLVNTWIYDLPFGKGRHWAKSGPMSYIIGNFSMSGSALFSSGKPYTIFAGTNNSAIDNGLQQALANVIGQSVFVGDVDCWFYTSKSSACKSLRPSGTDAFAVPVNPNGSAVSQASPTRFGNIGRNTQRGPKTVIWDFSMQRTFPIMEQRSLEFRWEAFNLFNNTQFALPNRDASAGNFGTITGLASDPRIMQFSLRLKF